MQLTLFFFYTYDFFYGCRGGSGLALIILQPRSFLILGNGFQAQSDLFFGLVHLDDFKVTLLANRYWEILRLPSRVTRHFGIVAQTLDALGQLDERAESGQTTNPAVHHVANMMRLKIPLPGVRLQLLDPQREPVRLRID